ncbi:succinyl-diaminopimelate desuccinylase [Vulcanisaeta moutnovskia 768-28]|uniref:Succinyl-diaminopimelate desuccinylase n=1 Tax=Vulcanisaeta moutnovskia (strain 768-28) TaxID=985053 RepID=F0QYX2_VULM7|nr:succinyl-diaminopimelate desuccinylase [Vulcanisaeta moutnovskia 768-28]
MSSMYESISRKVDELRNEIINTLTHLISIPAVNPSYGGEGELEKANALLEIIRGWPFDEVKRIDAPDRRAKGGVRPNILAIYRGKDESAGKLWIVTHLDVVPPGDLSAWTVTKPFEPKIVGDKIYGRGTEDNGQSLVASLYAVKALMELGIRPRRTVVLAFVSDEEAGSDYGIKYLMSKHPELFDKKDQALVPDAGNSDGSFIEVAEKSILWLKFKVYGKQTHGSTPHKGLNAHEVAITLANLLKNLLITKYSIRDALYEPPESTFEITMVSGTATSPNIVPGYHEFVMDSRVLPQYSLDEVLRDIGNAINLVKAMYHRKIENEEVPRIEVETIQRLDAPKPTPTDAEIVKALVKVLRETRGIEPKIGGIGGGTFAAYFRMLEIPAVVWSTIDEVAHQPNEYTKITNLINDTKTIATLITTI